MDGNIWSGGPGDGPNGLGVLIAEAPHKHPEMVPDVLERIANEKLIEAAPDLLAASKDALKRLQRLYPNWHEYTPFAALAAAIEKATVRNG